MLLERPCSVPQSNKATKKGIKIPRKFTAESKSTSEVDAPRLSGRKALDRLGWHLFCRELETRICMLRSASGAKTQKYRDKQIAPT